MKKIKTIRGYTALARFNATLKTKPNGDFYIAGYMAGYKMPVQSPYCYSPAYVWDRLANKNQDCVKKLETREEHESLVSEIEATEQHLKHLKGK